MGLKDTWPKIIEIQRLGQPYNNNNRHKGNLGSRFQ